jgi:capsular exopolysaccharide synthesis family protein
MTSQASDPLGYLKVLWRWKWIFLVCVIVPPVAAYLLTKHEPKKYSASALIQESASKSSGSALAAAAAGSSGGGSAVLGGQARIIETPAIADMAARYLTPRPKNPAVLLNKITATPNSSTGFITIKATASHPAGAADLANAFAKAIVNLRSRQADRQSRAEIGALKLQLAHVSKKSKSSRTQVTELTQQINQLEAARASQPAPAAVLQSATPNKNPVSPQPTRTIGLALLAGILVGLAAVFVAEAVDRKVRDPEDLEQLSGLPLLSVLPKAAFNAGNPLSPAAESFHGLRSALRYFNVDRPVPTVLVASAAPGEGKTTVACGLAIAAAQAGISVVLLDADLRAPQVAARLLDEQAIAGHDGLAGVLTGQDHLCDELIEVEIAGSAGAGALGGRLQIVPAGPPPPNPSELLASARMRVVLDELREISDLVVIDASPLLRVSDALPMLDLASGVVVVAKLGVSTTAELQRLLKTVQSTSAVPLGMVATGATRRQVAKYGYGRSRGAAAGESFDRSGRREGRRQKLAVLAPTPIAAPSNPTPIAAPSAPTPIAAPSAQAPSDTLAAAPTPTAIAAAESADPNDAPQVAASDEAPALPRPPTLEPQPNGIGGPTRRSVRSWGG